MYTCQPTWGQILANFPGKFVPFPWTPHTHASPTLEPQASGLHHRIDDMLYIACLFYVQSLCLFSWVFLQPIIRTTKLAKMNLSLLGRYYNTHVNMLEWKVPGQNKVFPGPLDKLLKMGEIPGLLQGSLNGCQLAMQMNESWELCLIAVADLEGAFHYIPTMHLHNWHTYLQSFLAQ